MTELALEIRSLSASFGSRLLFSDVSLALARGESAALVGPSGVGKTTLLNCVLGIVLPRSGSITVAGEDVTGVRGDRLAEADEATFLSSPLGTAGTVWRAALGVESLEVVEGQHEVDPVSTMFVSRRDGEDVDLEALRDLLTAHTVPAWAATCPGGDWMGGAVRLAEDGRWITALGLPCLAIALLALWAGYSNELRRATRSLFATQLLAPDKAFVRGALAMRIVAPVIVAAGAGSALTVILSIPQSRSGEVGIPYRFIAFCASITLATGIIAWDVTWRACVRATRRSSAPPDA